MFKALLTRYVQEAYKQLLVAPHTFRPVSLLQDFRAWYATQDPETNPLREGLPWITFGAIRHLRHKINPDFKVYEFGAGGSTLFFHRNCSVVITCEHDPVWAEKVRTALADAGIHHAEIKVIEPTAHRDDAPKDPKKPEDYASHSPAYFGMSFERYARCIDQYPDGFFDLIVVDGRSRPSCVKHAIPKLASGGTIVVDNAERPVYAATDEMLRAPQFRRLNFYGPGPFNGYFWLTSIWERRCVN